MNNERFEIIVPTLFGLEAMVSKELYRLGYDAKKVEDGRVTFDGDYDAV
ncbi:MAG: class I SAM-dependent RNA methyltransferase, partial [Candidatus Ornithomonoglobus sp.]